MKRLLWVERTLVRLLPCLHIVILWGLYTDSIGQGQRQLLALARGLLKLHNSSFLIMDESTANLDHATDQTIQNVLRTGLKDTQMLVIAHRLLTVVELDK
jgi:ABC-type multidrug transport system fused ATPase/permease subunit